MKIYKYTIEKFVDKQLIKVPVGAKFLSLQTQNNIPCLWFLVNENETVDTTIPIFTIGTGQPIHWSITTMTFLGTYQLFDGELIYHVFGDMPV